MTTSVPTTKPPGEGWLPWGVGPGSPYDYVEVEVWRKGWHGTALQHPRASPLMNVHGLYWRPAGPILTDEARLAEAILNLLR